MGKARRTLSGDEAGPTAQREVLPLVGVVCSSPPCSDRQKTLLRLGGKRDIAHSAAFSSTERLENGRATGVQEQEKTGSPGDVTLLDQACAICLSGYSPTAHIHAIV